VALWISDKQDAFVTGIAEESRPYRTAMRTTIPPRPGQAGSRSDSHASFRCEKKSPRLRGSKQSVLNHRSDSTPRAPPPPPGPESVGERDPLSADYTPNEDDSGGRTLVLDTTVPPVRGIRKNDRVVNRPAGIANGDALDEVRQSIPTDLDAKRGVRQRSN